MRFCSVLCSAPSQNWKMVIRLDLKSIKTVGISSLTSLGWLVFSALKELLQEQDVHGDCGNDEQETGYYGAASPLKHSV